jgi:uracil-DNA glycosylase
MRTNAHVQCEHLPCAGVNHTPYAVPAVKVDAERVRVVLISESAPSESGDNYYQGDSNLYARTTLAAFRSAGLEVEGLQGLLDRGIYLTNAIKCGKIGYAVPTAAIGACSVLLEQELALFTEVRAYLLMGDVAIKSVNAIARRNREPRPIPAGATYRMRGGEFWFRGARALPSYLQAGPSYGIEKSKVAMIAEDIAAALRIAGIG